MSVPTLEEVREALALFANAPDAKFSVKTLAKTILEALARLPKSNIQTQNEVVVAENPLKENELDELCDLLIKSSQLNVLPEFTTTIKNNISFAKALYHAYLVIVYHYPRNSIVNGEAIDGVTYGNITPERLFIDFNQRQWDIDSLFAWEKSKGYFENPTNQIKLLPQEIEWLNKIAKNLMVNTLTLGLNDPDASVVMEAITRLQSSHNEKDIIRPLVNCLRHTDNAVVKLAFSVLVPLSRNNNNQTALRDANAIPILMGCLSHPDNEIVKHAISILIYMSTNENNQTALRDANVIPILMGCLSHTDNEIVKHAISILIYMFTNENNQTALRDANAIPILMGCLSHPDNEIVKHAISILIYMSRYENNQTALRDANVIPILMGCLSHTDNEIVKYALGALVKMLRSSNKDAIRDANVVPTVLRLLKHEDSDVVKLVLATLNLRQHWSYNFSCDANTFPALIECLNHTDQGIVSQALEVLSHTSSDLYELYDKSEAVTRDVNTIPALVKCFNHPDNKVVKQALEVFILVLLYMDTIDLSHENLIPAVMNCLNHTDLEVAGKAFELRDRTRFESLWNNADTKAIPGLLRLLELNHPHTVWGVIRNLCALSRDSTNHAALRDANVMPALVTCLERGNNANAWRAVQVLEQLAKSSENHLAMREANVIPELVKWLNVEPIKWVSYNNYPEFSQYTADIFLNLSKNPENRSAIFNASALSPIISLLELEYRYGYNHATKVTQETLYNLILPNRSAAFIEHETLDFVQNAADKTPFIKNGLTLLSNDHHKMRTLGRVLLNNIDFSNAIGPQTSEQSKLDSIEFDAFLKRVMSKTIQASRLLTTTGARRDKTEKLDQHITCLRSLLDAKKELLEGGDLMKFKEVYTTAINDIKPHIQQSMYGGVKRLFTRQANFMQDMLAMESRLSTMISPNPSLSWAT